jgi:hypothetical protein
MNSIRIARAALRVRSVAVKAPLQRRGYADAVADKVGPSRSQALRTLLTLPDQIELESSSSGTNKTNLVVSLSAAVHLLRGHSLRNLLLAEIRKSTEH